MGIRIVRSRAEQTEDNGRRLLAAARTVFMKRGYQAATLEQVARHAGLTKGAVYARFDSKAELFLALLSERIDARIAELSALPAPVSAVDAAEGLFRQWLERSREAAWGLLVLEFRCEAARDRPLNARYAALHERVIEAVAARIEAGALAEGVRLRTPARALARLGLSLANGLLLERAIADDRELPEALTIEANGALIAAFREAGAAARGRGHGGSR